MRRLFVALIVLVALFVIVDRVALAGAEREMGKRLQSAADLEERPDVDVHGFPFLTQVVSGYYDQVDVTVPHVAREGVRLDDLVVRLGGVRAPLREMLSGSGTDTVRAGSAGASAVVPYATVEREAPQGLQIQPRGDELRLAGDVTVLGQQLPASAQVKVSVRGDDLAFEPSNVEVDGRSVNGALSRRLAFTVPVGRLPLGLRLTGVHVTKDGLQITASGNDLTFTR